MRVGDLRKRVTLQAETASSDAGGGYTLGWGDVATVWASITPVNGQEHLAAGHLESHVTHRIQIRYRADVTAAMRIAYGSRFFNIRAVLNSGESNRWLDLLAEEGVAQ